MWLLINCNKNVWREVMKENMVFRMLRRRVQTKTRIRPRLLNIDQSVSIMETNNQIIIRTSL